jgi:hypothetical protein
MRAVYLLALCTAWCGCTNAATIANQPDANDREFFRERAVLTIVLLAGLVFASGCYMRRQRTSTQLTEPAQAVRELAPVATSPATAPTDNHVISPAKPRGRHR